MELVILIFFKRNFYLPGLLDVVFHKAGLDNALMITLSKHEIQINPWQ